MELAELAAATERARQKADLEIAASMAAAQVSSAKIKADADVMVAKYGVDEAEMNARAAEASAMAEESKVAIEQIKRDTEIVKLDQLKAQESIVVAEAEAEVAKTNAIAFAAGYLIRKIKRRILEIFFLQKKRSHWLVIGIILVPLIQFLG